MFRALTHTYDYSPDRLEAGRLHEQLPAMEARPRQIRLKTLLAIMAIMSGLCAIGAQAGRTTSASHYTSK